MAAKFSQMPRSARVAGGGTISLPKRVLLVDQTAEALRGMIETGQWSGCLPGEEEMRRRLDVSRVTLRKALAVLAAQGSITPGGRGRKSEISAGPGHRALRPGASRVCWLSPVPNLELVWSSRVILEELGKSLQARGLHLEFQYVPALWRGDPAKRLTKLTSGADTAGWVLFRASSQIQGWFQHHRMPCIVMGPCHGGVRLPGVQIDVEALGRHAAAEASRLGHRHMAYVVFDPMVASSVMTLKGLRQLKMKDGTPGRVSVIADDETIVGLRRELAAVLTGPDPATVILLTEAAQALPVMGIVQELGMHVPGDVSIIVRDHEPILERSVPMLSRYAANWQRYGQSAGRLLANILQQGTGTARFVKLMPEFIRGESLGPRKPVRA